MLQAIHDKSKGVFAMIIIGVIGVVFVFWGVEFVSVGGLTASRGVEVNGEDVNAETVRRAYQEELSQYQVAFGAAGVPEEVRQAIEQQVVNEAVRGELVRQRTAELRFLASDAEVLQSLQEIPAFQVDGRFSRDAYYAALRAANIEPDYFESQQRQLLAARQLDRGIFASAFVLPGEIERRVALRDESRDIGWVVLPASRFMADLEPDEAAIAAHYEQTRGRYLTDERADLQYVELTLDALASEVETTEEALLEFYNDHLDRYTTREQRRARHILVAASDDPAADQAQAQAAYERAVAGEDFAALAQALSADPGSAAQGGDLGWAEPEFFVAPFAEAVWALQPGEISAPVQSEFGWHVIRLDEVRAGSVQSFDEVRAELEPEYRRAESERRYNDMQEQLDTEAFEASGDLQRVAEALALEVRSVPGFTRTSGGPLGDSPALVEAVFDPEVIGGEQLRTVELAPGRVVAVKVTAHQPPSERPLAEVREEVIADLRLTLARQQAQARAGELVAELNGGADWATVARPWSASTDDGAGLMPRQYLRSATEVPAEVLAAAFRAPRPQAAPVSGVALLASGDTAVWTVTAVRSGTLEQAPAMAQAEATRDAREYSSFQDASVYISQLRANAKVKVNPTLFN
jgi:peptidyl-prolyl cis-trans isomerase D